MGKTQQRKTQQEPKTKDIHRANRNHSPRSVRSGNQGDYTLNLTGILSQKFIPKTQGDCGRWIRRVESWACAIQTQTAPGLAGDRGCMRGQALPCTEGATGSSRRIFPQKKKTLWGSLGNSPAATAPVSSVPHHRLEDCVHLISEGAETTGTTRGRVPS